MSSPLRLCCVNYPSYVWTSISAEQKLLILGIRHKVHSGYGVNMSEDPWIPTTPLRPAMPNARNPKMTVIDLIKGESKEWDVGLLENYVVHDDIP